MLDLFSGGPTSAIIFLISLVVAITIHEFAHALVADYLGDPTPRLNGRLSLNPLAHLDPLGTLALLLVGFGWGKPVPIDPYNLRYPRRDSAFISLAGPGSNLLLATVLSLLIRFVPALLPFSNLLIPVIVLNVALAVFNLLPVGPLDGAKILIGFVPPQMAADLEDSLERYGLFLLLFVLFPIVGGQSLASLIITPIINFILHLLLPFTL
jgi:Zn-dependent protease